MITTLCVYLSLCLLPRTGQNSEVSVVKMPVEATGGWAVLSEGRIKPLATLAEETMISISGRNRVGEIGPLDLLWGCHLDWPVYSELPVIKINGEELKVYLGLDPGERRFSYRAISSNQAFRELVERANAMLAAEENLPGKELDSLRVYDKLQRLAALGSGEVLQLVPGTLEAGQWRLPDTLQNSENPQEIAVYDGFKQLAAAFASRDANQFASVSVSLSTALRAVNPTEYPSQSSLDREVHYQDINAFGKAWKVYLLGFLVLALFGRSSKKVWYSLGMMFLVLGFIGHTYGLALRWQIAGRAPVSDMYESLVFMGWGTIAIGLALEFFNRKGMFGLAAGLMGFLALAFAENLPIDSSINPLVPVLANTSWLSIHVMTIMLSYSAFALAMTMGHIALFLQFFNPGRSHQLRSLTTLLYKTLQVGVLFLAAGIAFGAIWANESWGRYWGWDPKETWSLITFFVYMIVVHARYAGWVNHFGLAVSSIAAFLAVVMTYYGVNFILGSGLHSYGTSEGGQFWMLTYLVGETAIVLLALARYKHIHLPSAGNGSSGDQLSATS
jgi:cytochrome c-type biogenesis protein CcsB